jgi:membrane-bound metal-dependent hydrolase YbcI (DUF457 family)
MANFRSHITGGVLTASGLIFVTHGSLSMPLLSAPLLASVCVIGSMFPDLDSDKGRPVELVFRFVSVLLSVTFTLVGYGELTFEALVGSILLIVFFTRYLLRPMFEKFTVHRGIFHSIPMALFMTSLLVLFSKPYMSHINWLLGFYFMAGYVTHLVMDEIWSIDLLGLRFKRSFGTALKLIGKPASLALFLYFISGVLFVLVYFMEYTNAKDTSPFMNQLTSVIAPLVG